MEAAAVVTPSAADVMRQAALDAEAFHARSTIKQVRTASLIADRSYQRDLSMNLVDEIAGDWNEVASELILVSDRGEEGLFVINGQHRTAAARKLNMETIWARVVDLSDLDDPGLIEADLRLRTNKRLSDRPPERFKAQLRAGDPESIAIRDLLAAFDTQINFIPSIDYGLNSVSSVESVYRVDGGGLLHETLTTIKAAYGRVDSQTASANMLKAVAWFIDKHGLEANGDRLAERMKSIGITALDTRARMMKGTMGGSIWSNVYRALVDIYNENLHQKNKLEFSLRGRGARGKRDDAYSDAGTVRTGYGRNAGGTG